MAFITVHELFSASDELGNPILATRETRLNTQYITYYYASEDRRREAGEKAAIILAGRAGNPFYVTETLLEVDALITPTVE